MALFSSMHLLKVPKIKKSPSMVITGKNKKTSRDLKESLLTGEMSDSMNGRKASTDVPRGFLAVYVGPELQRFVIPASFLSHLDFRALMESVEDEFGFEQEGGLKIPCEEEVFEKVLQKCATNDRLKSKSKKKVN